MIARGVRPTHERRINTLGFLSLSIKDIRHVSLVLAARLQVFQARTTLELMSHINLLRFRMSLKRHVNLVVALRGTRFVLIIVVHVNLPLALKCDYLYVWPVLR